MIKKIFICALLCIMVCTIAGCSNCIASNSSSDNGSLTSSTQSTTSASTVSSTPTQSTEESFESSSTQSTTSTSTVSSTPTQSTEESFESSSTQSTTSVSTVSSTPTQSEKPTNLGDDNMDDTYTLIVKGKKIATTNHMKLNYEYNYAELPLIAIIKELGAKVEWQNKTTAKITFNEKAYILDTAEGSLIVEGSTFNALTVSPGTMHGVFYRVVGNEFIIDSDSAELFLFYMMGIKKLIIDHDNRIVNIS